MTLTAPTPTPTARATPDPSVHDKLVPRARKVAVRPPTVGITATQEEVLAQTQSLIQSHYHSVNTVKKYNTDLDYVRRWMQVAECVKDCADGLDVLSNRSARLVMMFLGAHMNSLTAKQYVRYHSALVNHFALQHKCSKQPQLGWRWRSPDDWIGNPAYDHDYQLAKTSLRNKTARDGTGRDHAPPCRYIHLEPFLIALQEQMKVFAEHRPPVLTRERTTFELTYAFSVVAYRLWARCDELCRMTWTDLKVKAEFDEGGNEFSRARLTFRKTNQTDEYANSDYLLYKLSGRPLVHALPVITQWRRHWTLAAGREPQKVDLVFPVILKSGELDVGRQNDSRAILSALRTSRKLLDDPDEAFDFTTLCT